MKPRNLDERIQETVFLKFFLWKLFSKNAWIRFAVQKKSCPRVLIDELKW
jgi:hypothetical protein